MLLAVNGHLQRQKSSTCDSRPLVSSLYLPIECGASTLNFLCDKALVGYYRYSWLLMLPEMIIRKRATDVHAMIII